MNRRHWFWPMCIGIWERAPPKCTCILIAPMIRLPTPLRRSRAALSHPVMRPIGNPPPPVASARQPSCVRQSINANHALARSKADWMFHIDADELIWQNAPLGAELAAVAELGAELHLPVQERFYPSAVGTNIYDGAFRASTKDRKGFDPQIFGDQSEYLVCGVLGHAAGKCAVPVQDGYSLGVHWGYRGGTGRDHRLPRYGSTAARLLHFDGLTAAALADKLLRYAAHDIDYAQTSGARSSAKPDRQGHQRRRCARFA
ncbi:hypothetical protein GQR58_000242 [Nymphon striatum]|nr:hypothetical protein GQR58_000242 [Nymphon striatum]